MGKVKKVMSLKQGSQEAHEKKKRRGPIDLLAGIAIALFAGFAVFAIVRDQISIRENELKRDELIRQTNEINEKNAQINAYLEDDEKLKEYLEDIARNKLGYANADERIYYVIPAGEQAGVSVTASADNTSSEDNSTASE